MARVVIPEPLRRFAEGCAEQPVEGRTVGEVLDRLAGRFPELGPRIFTPDGQLRAHLMVFLDGRSIRFSRKADLRLRPDAEVRLVAAMEGG